MRTAAKRFLGGKRKSVKKVQKRGKSKLSVKIKGRPEQVMKAVKTMAGVPQDGS